MLKPIYPAGNVLLSILLRHAKYFSFYTHFGINLLRTQQELLMYTFENFTEHCERNEPIKRTHYTGVYIGRSDAVMCHNIITHS